MLYDLLAAVRSLRRHPTFTALAGLTIALGIGATTAIFSVVEALVLRPLPYPNPDRLVDVSHMTKEGSRLLASWFDVVDLRLETEIFEDVAARAATVTEVVLTNDFGEPYEAAALQTTYNYLSVLGVTPAMGRTFSGDDGEAGVSPDENAPDPVPSVVITYGLWQRVLGEDPNFADRTIRIRGNPARVIGVLPRDFQLLHERRYRWVSGSGVELFLSTAESFLAEGSRSDGRRGRDALQVGRLREGITYERAQASLDALAARYRAEFPVYADDELTLPLRPIRDDLTEGAGGIVLVLAGGVMFLMLLVCANVANLMLVRGQIRSGEDAVRSVLGCGTLRLSTQKFWESAILGLGGGALGLALGWMAIRAVETLGPRNVPLLNQVEMNTAAVLFAVAATMGAVVVFGLIPALQVGRLDLAGILRIDAGRGSVRERRTLMKGLVISELALSTVLLSGALVMVRSMAALTNADLGFDPEGLITFDLIRIDDQEPNFFEALQTSIRQLEPELAAIPGVVSVGRTSMPPLSGRVFSRNFGGTEEVLERQTERADLTWVNREYFQTMGTRLLAGRYFDERDFGEGSTSRIVDEAIARRAWPGEAPIGKRIYYEVQGTVVGVVESMLMRDFGNENVAVGTIHHPELQVGQATTFVIRTAVDPATMIASVRETVRAVDPGLAAYSIQDLSARVRVARAPTRFVLFAMGSFAVIAFVVAVGGLFGVISYGVRTRTAEFGVRMALGAQKKMILAMVLRQGAALALVGVVAGIGGTLLVSRVLASVVYEVSPTDPVLLGATALILGVTSVLACYAPARWASGLDPVRALAS